MEREDSGVHAGWYSENEDTCPFFLLFLGFPPFLFFTQIHAKRPLIPPIRKRESTLSFFGWISLASIAKRRLVVQSSFNGRCEKVQNVVDDLGLGVTSHGVLTLMLSSQVS